MLIQRLQFGLLYKIAGDMHISKYRRAKLEMNYLSSLKMTGKIFHLKIVKDHKVLFTNILKRLLASLSEKQRTVFLMSRMEGLKIS